MAIRLIVSDLDGTLLAPDRTISDQAVEAIRSLRERGVLFTFITGRPWYAAERFARRVGITLPTITCNGAVINRGYEMIWRKPLALKPLRELLEQAAGLGLTVLYSECGSERAMARTAWTDKRDYTIHCPTAEEWETLQADKVNIISDGLDGLFDHLSPVLEGARAVSTVVRYGSAGCEISALGINKAETLKEYARQQGIPLRDTLAVGDNANDLELLRAAGVGAAVANATEEAKAAADYICQASYTDGVIEAIQKFCPEEGRP